MGDVTLIGVDLAKRVFICTALLGMDRLCFAKSCLGLSLKCCDQKNQKRVCRHPFIA